MDTEVRSVRMCDYLKTVYLSLFCHFALGICAATSATHRIIMMILSYLFIYKSILIGRNKCFDFFVVSPNLKHVLKNVY